MTRPFIGVRKIERTFANGEVEELDFVKRSPSRAVLLQLKRDTHRLQDTERGGRHHGIEKTTSPFQRRREGRYPASPPVGQGVHRRSDSKLGHHRTNG